MDQREVLAAWEKFVERGALSSDLRSSVAASWQRSRNHRVTVDRARAPLVADAELFRRRSKYAPLRHAARCALENSKTFLRDANSIMILTDPSGLVIDTQCDDRVIDAGRAVHLEHRGRWSEADIGTNAIGAAIAESKPSPDHGTEHFCSEVQRWTALPSRFMTRGHSAMAGYYYDQHLDLTYAYAQRINLLRLAIDHLALCNAEMDQARIEAQFAEQIRHSILLSYGQAGPWPRIPW